jgi:hypothetical protein
MDLVVRAITEALDGGSWVMNVYSTSHYLRNQQTLIVDMGCKCPKKTNRWLHLGMVLDFLILHEVRILQFIQDKLDNPGRSAVPPELTHRGWVITHAVAPAVSRINRAFVELQGRHLIICQQRQYVDLLVGDLITMFDVHNTHTKPIDEWIPQSDYIISGEWWVKTSTIVQHIEDCSRRAQRHYSELDEHADIDDANGQRCVVREIGVFVVDMIQGIVDLQAERDDRNDIAVDVAPPVTPAALAKIRPSIFRSDVLDPRRDHIRRFWTEQQIDEIENQQKILHTAYRTDARIKALLGSHDHSTGFNQAWDMLSSVTYGRLRQFVGGLATVLANTTSIESDFSILKWEKDEYRTCLMDISLEGIFQSKQFEEIGDL